jgi:CheY-like chemotaxis protein
MATESPLPDRVAPNHGPGSDAAARSIEELLVAVAALRQAAAAGRPARGSARRPAHEAARRPSLAAETSPRAAAARDAAQPAPRRENGNPTVLVVEDDAKLLELMTSAFERAGFAVHGAENGRRAIQLLDRVGPDLLVTDIVMPEMEGIATMMGVRARRPDVAVIAISGGGAYGRGDTYLGWAGQLGADEVLSKPFRMSALIAAARGVLAGRNPIGHEEG